MKFNFFSHCLIKQKALLLTLLLVLVSTGQSQAQEVIEIEGTSIRGNQELPQILYLVPWQAPDIRVLTEAKSNLALQAPLAPIERYDYLRMLEYHAQFKAQNVKPKRLSRSESELKQSHAMQN